MEYLYKFNYQKSEGENWCGPACLSMVYDYFGKQENQRDIILDIVIDNLEKMKISTSEMVKSAVQRGFCSCQIRITNPHSLWEWCVKNKTILVMLHKMINSDNDWHYSIFNGKDDNFIYTVDPAEYDDGDNVRKYEIEKFIELWQFNGQIKGESKKFYSGVLFSNNTDLFNINKCYHCEREYYRPVMNCDEGDVFACPYCVKNYAQISVIVGQDFVKDEKRGTKLFDDLIFKKISLLRDELKKENIYLPFVSFKSDINISPTEMILVIDNRISYMKDLNGFNDEQIANELLNALKLEFNFENQI